MYKLCEEQQSLVTKHRKCERTTRWTSRERERGDRERQRKTFFISNSYYLTFYFFSFSSSILIHCCCFWCLNFCVRFSWQALVYISKIFCLTGSVSHLWTDLCKMRTNKTFYDKFLGKRFTSN